MADLHVYGVIDDELMSDVRSSLNGVPTTEPLDVYVSSPGGILSHGVTIYNWLQRYDSVSVHVEGDAMSAATLITSAGDFVDMPNNALMMVHDPWLPVLSPVTLEQLSRTTKYLEATKRQALEIYHSKTRLATGQLSELMRRETYLAADEGPRSRVRG